MKVSDGERQWMIVASPYFPSLSGIVRVVGVNTGRLTTTTTECNASRIAAAGNGTTNNTGKKHSLHNLWPFFWLGAPHFIYAARALFRRQERKLDRGQSGAASKTSLTLDFLLP